MSSVSGNPVATAASLGMIQVGSGLAITAGGLLSAPAGPFVPVSYFAALAADVAMSAATTNFDGPSLVLPIGTYDLSGAVLFDIPLSGEVFATVWDGATVYSAGGLTFATLTGAAPLGQVVFGGRAVLAAGATLKITAQASQSDYIMKASTGAPYAGNVATWLRAVRIA